MKGTNKPNSKEGTRRRNRNLERRAKRGQQAIGKRTKKLHGRSKVSVVMVAVNNDEQITSLIQKIKHLRVEEVIVIVSGSDKSAFWRARNGLKALVVYHPLPLDWEDAKTLGTRLAKSNNILFLNARDSFTLNDLIKRLSTLKKRHDKQSDGQQLPNSIGVKWKSTSIIIPTYNAVTRLKESLGSIYIHTKPAHEVIVVDNGSSDGTLDVCLTKGVILLSLPTNIGYPKACNLGMRAAAGNEILLLNNDVIVTDHWLENMLGCLSFSSDVGIVGPMTNYAFGVQKVPGTNFNDIEMMHYFAAEWNHPNPSQWRDVKRIVGLCMLIKRDLINQIGWLDERFSPGYYEDDDYCYRAHLAGFRIMLAGDVFVHHYGSRSFGRASRRKRRLLRTNRMKFVNKWGFDPLMLRSDIAITKD